MRICDLCKNTNVSPPPELKEVDLHVNGVPVCMVDEACPSCIKKIQDMMKPVSPQKVYRDRSLRIDDYPSGPESLYRGNDLYPPGTK